LADVDTVNSEKYAEGAGQGRMPLQETIWKKSRSAHTNRVKRQRKWRAGGWR